MSRTSPARTMFRAAFGLMRRTVKHPAEANWLIAPECSAAAWKAATAALVRLADETHGVMRWAPEGRANAAMVDGHRYRLRYGQRRPVKRLPD